jgi:hypothetical protein
MKVSDLIAVLIKANIAKRQGCLLTFAHDSITAEFQDHEYEPPIWRGRITLSTTTPYKERQFGVFQIVNSKNGTSLIKMLSLCKPDAEDIRIEPFDPPPDWDGRLPNGHIYIGAAADIVDIGVLVARDKPFKIKYRGCPPELISDGKNRLGESVVFWDKIRLTKQVIASYLKDIDKVIHEGGFRLTFFKQDFPVVIIQSILKINGKRFDKAAIDIANGVMQLSFHTGNIVATYWVVAYKIYI